MTGYCEKMHTLLLNRAETLNALATATKIVSNAINNHKQKHGTTYVRELHRVRSFTFELIEEAKKHQPKDKYKKASNKLRLNGI